MRATGIVRRVDNLGRVVIPKEIRRTMHICEGDSLEIFVEATGEIIFKKYSSIGEIGNFAEKNASLLSKSVALPVFICDKERIVAASGTDKNDVIGSLITKEYDKLVRTRKPYVAKEDRVLYPIQGLDMAALVCVPIIAAGDICGSVVLLENETLAVTDIHIKLAQFVADSIGEQLAH